MVSNNSASKLFFAFDLDGTIINSTNIGPVIEQELYKKYAVNITGEKRKEVEALVFEILQGENRKKLGAKLMWAIFKKLGLSFPQRISALILSGKIYKREVPKIRLFDGILELFEYMERNSYEYSIITTSSAKEVDDRLKKFPEFYKKLDGRIIPRSAVKNLKPHPEGIMKAAEIMGMHNFSNCVMVGDMHTDIQMGKAVRAITVGVLTGVFTRERFEEFKPDFIIASAAELPKIIDKIKAKINGIEK